MTDGADAATVALLDAYTAKRRGSSSRLESLYAVAKNAKADKKYLDSFRFRYEKIEYYMQDFEKYHELILNLVNSAQKVEELNKSFSKFEETYFETKLIYNKLFPKVEKSEPNVKQNVQLPKIELKHFDGRVQDWVPYWDLFSSLIDKNDALSSVEKLTYLISTLSKEPYSLIKQLSLTDTSYDIAKEILKSRYANSRRLASIHVNEILFCQSLNIESASGIRKILDTFSENLSALRTLKFNTDGWDFLLFTILLQKLDNNTRTQFEKKYSDVEMPTYGNLTDFLTGQAKALESVKIYATENKSSRNTNNNMQKTNFRINNSSLEKSTFLTSEQRNVEKCSICNSQHSISECFQFLSKPPKERYELVKLHRLCIKCLRGSHSVRNCTARANCSRCRGRHSTFLHFDSGDQSPAGLAINTGNCQRSTASPNSGVPSTSRVEFSNEIQQNKNANETSLAIYTNYTVLLSTVLIRILDCRGNYQTIRAILDTASTSCIITQKCCLRLGLKRTHCANQIFGISQSQAIMPKGKTTCIIVPKMSEHPRFVVDAIVLPRISSDMPSRHFSYKQWSNISNLNLADPSFNMPGEIDMLLGAEIYSQIVKSDHIIGGPGQPTAIDTAFGWVIMGRINFPSSDEHTFLINSESSLEASLKKFWELENVPEIKQKSPDDIKCENLYKNSVFRNTTGSYTVALPFKESENLNFVGIREIAYRRLISLERRLSRDKDLRISYNKFMQEYLDNAYMSEVTPDITDHSQSYYLCHFCVLRPDAPSTKIRIVMDAAAKDLEGKSLNDCLHSGPKLQQDLVAMLMCFRLYPIIFTADIKQMFLRIELHNPHRKFQKLLWRFDPSGPVKEYILNRVIFGLNSSPWLALRTLLQLAKDEKIRYPLAAKIIENNTYVDDFLAGFYSVPEALKAQSELIAMLDSGGFEVHKWSSNCQDVIDNVAASDPHKCLNFDKNEPIKILGMQYNLSVDQFFYKCTPMSDICTKRTILSDLSKYYDPLGFISPVTIWAKQIMQYLWSLGLEWDATPPKDVVEKWSQFKSDLINISQLLIPRFLSLNKNDIVEIHGFADSSQKSYCAVIYFRKCETKDTFSTSLICAKTKVAPLQTISLARLELCAALLLSKLMTFVIDIYKDKISFSKMYAWSDSTVALSWIRTIPCKLNTFVANRVSVIQDRIAPENWHHIRTNLNSADFGTRGMFPSELISCSQWWNGPEFLKMPKDQWPISNVKIGPATEEIKKVVLLSNTNETNVLDSILENFSSLSKIVGIVFYIRKFINNTRYPNNKILRKINSFEFHNSLLLLVKHVQRENFAEEIANIENKIPCSKQIRKLCPFVKDGILRVGGRLVHSNLNFESKHPVLLPQKHRLTFLLIGYYHLKYLHPGIQTLQCLIRQKFWILASKRVIRSYVSKCIKCFRVDPKPIQPIMGNLPDFRVNTIKSFKIVGCDLGGPYFISLGRFRGSKTQKAYICVFVCAATKALHIELVSDLTSEAFLAALRRFVGRRGPVSRIFSDNGTNFVGAARQLKEIMQNSAEKMHIRWDFNVPSASHTGGLFESAIKQVKAHLKRVIGDQILSYEELNTLLIQIEAVLNSRPLCPLSSDPNDLEPLTPAHFLVMEPLNAVPDDDLSHLKLNRLSRWQLIQRMSSDFWKRYQMEYLNTLQQRNKWNTDSPINLEIGSLVVIKNEILPPLKCSLGRVTNVFPGKDGVIRFAEVRTKNGTLKRPLVKLCPLPN